MTAKKPPFMAFARWLGIADVRVLPGNRFELWKPSLLGFGPNKLLASGTVNEDGTLTKDEIPMHSKKETHHK